MIDPAVRLRRAIRINDLALVQRITKSNPDVLVNPDFDNKNQTSLHIAAELGLVDIAAFLLDMGHDDEEISTDADWNTPLMVAAQHGQDELGCLLIERCPRCIPWTNRRGRDALSIACQHSDLTQLMLMLLNHAQYPASVHGQDRNGDTPLHHASAYGCLKALRILLDHGADPKATNAFDWTPLAYSQTVAAEVYFKTLIAEYERKSQQPSAADSQESSASREIAEIQQQRHQKGTQWQLSQQSQQQQQQQQQRRKIAMGVRLVTNEAPMLERQSSSAGSLQDRLEEQGSTITRTAMRNGGRGFEYQGLRARAASSD